MNVIDLTKKKLLNATPPRSNLMSDKAINKNSSKNLSERFLTRE
jgi:hypothetical protein